jgi:hypothetical protein
MHIKNIPIFVSNCHLFNFIDNNNIMTVANNVTAEYLRPINYIFSLVIDQSTSFNFRLGVLITFTFHFDI